MFGDGATSRSEFHSAMNFAGIHRPPVVFLCVNNSWAVSTPLDRQTASSEFAAKGNAYEVPNLRVDGNDPLAVYAVVKKARADTDVHGPTLIEAITWRSGFHTSSDNPDLYRHQQENKLWEPWDPIRRTRKYLARADWWNDNDESDLLARCADQIQRAVEQAENMDIPGPDSQFEDVFETSNWMLDEQRKKLLAEVADGNH
jgi:TPP-dependent pyruvate/acetoin dehydrogenase alpha subunit